MVKTYGSLFFEEQLWMWNRIHSNAQSNPPPTYPPVHHPSFLSSVHPPNHLPNNPWISANLKLSQLYPCRRLSIKELWFRMIDGSLLQVFATMIQTKDLSWCIIITAWVLLKVNPCVTTPVPLESLTVWLIHWFKDWLSRFFLSLHMSLMVSV